MAVNKKIISEFKGLKTAIKDPKELEAGQPQDSLNWLTGSKGDHIELRMGYKTIGTKVDGIGRVTGLKVATTNNGLEVPFFTYDRKIKYYKESIDDVVEIGSDVLPPEASGEDVAIESYNNIAGSFVYISSPNSSIYKIHTANPDNFLDQAVQSFRGYIKIKQNRTFVWNRMVASTKFWDKTGLSLSHIDKTLFSQYTAVSNINIGTGDGTTTAFSGTLTGRTGIKTLFSLSVKAGGGVATFAISNGGINYTVDDVLTVQAGDFNCTLKVTSVTADASKTITGLTITSSGTGYVKGANNEINCSGGTGNLAIIFITSITNGETISDQGDGTLIGSGGGVGTINYTTGNYVMNFLIPPANAQAILATYYLEDATSQGILDFTYSNPRTVGQGDYFRQDDGGGAMMNMFSIDGNVLCLHATKSWDLVLTSTDTNSTNIPYRDKVNIPYWRAGDETDEGVIALFIGDNKFPKLGMLSYGQYTTVIVPTPLSEEMDFTPYGIEKPVVKRWGNYDLMSVQGQTNGVNDTANNITFVRNILSGEFDKLDYNISVSDSYKGKLIAGDSISNNLLELFSGYDDDGDIINNFWISDQWNAGIEGTKRATYFLIDGFIAKDQNFDILQQYDNGSFVTVGNIDGSGSYVDLTAGTIVGSDTIGMQVIGGGSVPNAYHFRLMFKVNTPMFEDVTTMFKANAIGALQINEYGFVDIRFKGNKNIPVYTK